MLLDQAVEQRLLSRPPDLLEAQRAQASQRRGEGTGVDLHHRRFQTPAGRVLRDHARGRQADLPGPVQGQQQTSTDHVPRMPIGLHPVPSLANLQRQPPPRQLGASGHQFPDESYLSVGYRATAIGENHVHGPQSSKADRRTQVRLENSSGFFRKFFSASRFSLSESPAANRERPASRPDFPPRATPAVGEPPAYEPPRRLGCCQATNEIVRWKAVSDTANNPVRRRPAP